MVQIPFSNFQLNGELAVPAHAHGVILFAHGSGSSRHSIRNQSVARTLRARCLGTLLFDLLTEREEATDRYAVDLRFDIELLASRLHEAAQWFTLKHPGLPIGYFGSSTGAAAALVAAIRNEFPVHAIVSRGGRPDLAGAALPLVKTPTLLIVGSEDNAVVKMNRDAFERLNCPKQIQLVPGATHLFEEPGTLEKAADLAAAWFEKHLRK